MIPIYLAPSSIQQNRQFFLLCQCLHKRKSWLFCCTEIGARQAGDHAGQVPVTFCRRSPERPVYQGRNSNERKKGRSSERPVLPRAYARFQDALRRRSIRPSRDDENNHAAGGTGTGVAKKLTLNTSSVRL